jgi:Trypsin-co-occurring domain 1
MAADVLPIKIGDVDLLVEVTPVAGTEPTSRAGDAAGRVLVAFDTVREAIVGMAVSTKKVIDQTAERSVKPDHLEVKFGLSISAQGNVIIAGASGSASIDVTLKYDA